MEGLRFSTTAPFSDCFTLAMGLFSRLSWLLDIQSGPFDITAREDYERLECRLEELAHDDWAFEATSTGLWRPGVFPEFASLLYEDEFSYLVGIPAAGTEAVDAALRLTAHPFLSAEFFAAVEEEGACFLVELTGGEWEAYSPPEMGLAALLSHTSGVAPVSSAKWLRS